MKVEIRGMDEAADAVGEALEVYVISFADGVKDVANGILEGAKTRVPVATGELRESGKVVATESGAVVLFDAPYALTVHEIPRPHTNGEWKFLQRAVAQSCGFAVAKVSSRMQR